MTVADIYANPTLLRFLSEEEQTEDLCRAAVLASCYAIRYVKHQTEDLIRMAAECDPYCLLYVHNPSTDVQWSVLKRDPNNLQFLHAPTEDMVLFCLQRSGPNVLRYLQQDTEDIRRVVRNYNPRFEDYISANPIVPIYAAKKRIVMRGGGTMTSQFQSIE